MKLLVAIDSMKGSIGSRSAGEAFARGFLRVCPDAECTVIPIADGGEGTLDALVAEEHLRFVSVRLTDGRVAPAAYGCKGDTAVIEMARAAGLTLVQEAERDPLRATTYGVGELIRDALDTGHRRILLTVGGSGTNDGGTGMFCALGGKIFDAEGNLLPGGGYSLTKVVKIDASGLDPRLSECEFIAANDVKNPLLGAHGATAVYGPQKGVGPELLPIFESGMERFAALLEDASHKTVRSVAGCGAGGGILAPLLAFCNVTIRSGIDSVLDAAGFDSHLFGTDLVVTGEGRIDAQSAYGKAVSGVACRAGAAGVPVLAVGGRLGDGYEALRKVGVTDFALLSDYIPSSVPKGERLAYSMSHAAELLEAAGASCAGRYRTV